MHKLGFALCTALYVILIPILIVMSLMSVMVADDPNVTKLKVTLILFLSFCVPLSMLFAIFLMWSKYAKKKMRQAWICAGLPIYVAAIAFLLIAALFKL
jgi:uncharacterized BrkB/YihY/UPF0761 family membrane protein